jgi:phenylacetate-CoA ligase
MAWLGAIPDAEYLEPGDIEAIQRERWARQADHVRAASAFYRAHLGATRLTGRLEELADLPFTDKETIRADQRDHPPFGSYLAAPAERIARVHRTSGTTGVAMNLALSASDAEMTAKVGARAQSASGLGPGHRVVHCLNYQLWMGGYTDHATTEGLIRVIRELGVTAISCTPSYPAVLERVLADRFPGLAPKDLGLKLGLFGGEPGLDHAEFRQRIEETWGLAARNANYGVSDVLCNIAGQTAHCNDLHFMALDVLYPELIDPERGTRRPWAEGETGELVLTHMAKECQPLVRFRTGDIVALTGTGKARCGRTAPRLRVIGRSDDMVVVRGLNVFPAMLAGVINRFAELSGEYRITLGAPPHDFLPVEAELGDGRQGTDDLARQVEAAIKGELGVTAKVTLLAPASLPRTEGKTKRVVRTHP